MGNIPKHTTATNIISLQSCIMVIVCLVVITTIKPIFSVLYQNEQLLFELSDGLSDDFDEKDLEEDNREENKEESKEEKEEKKEQEKNRYTSSLDDSEYQLHIITINNSTRSYIELNQFVSELYIDILLQPPKQA